MAQDVKCLCSTATELLDCTRPGLWTYLMRNYSTNLVELPKKLWVVPRKRMRRMDRHPNTLPKVEKQGAVLRGSLALASLNS